MDKESVAERGKELVAALLAGKGMHIETGVNRRRRSQVRITDGSGSSLDAFVRTVNGGDWQFNVEQFLYVGIDEQAGTQRIEGLVPLADPSACFIFVWLGERKHRPNRFFVINHRQLQEIIRCDYQSMLERHGGGRASVTASTHCAVTTRMLAEFEDKWQALGLWIR